MFCHRKIPCSRYMCIKSGYLAICLWVRVQNEIKFDMIQHEESVMLNSRAKKNCNNFANLWCTYGVFIFFPPFSQSNHAVWIFSLLKRSKLQVCEILWGERNWDDWLSLTNFSEMAWDVKCLGFNWVTGMKSFNRKFIDTRLVTRSEKKKRLELQLLLPNNVFYFNFRLHKHRQSLINSLISLFRVNESTIYPHLDSILIILWSSSNIIFNIYHLSRVCFTNFILKLISSSLLWLLFYTHQYKVEKLNFNLLFPGFSKKKE